MKNLIRSKLNMIQDLNSYFATSATNLRARFQTYHSIYTLYAVILIYLEPINTRI
jgi:hypothetical protein